MGLINSILTWVMQKRIHQIELFIKYPHEVQEELFKKLIQTAASTQNSVSNMISPAFRRMNNSEKEFPSTPTKKRFPILNA